MKSETRVVIIGGGAMGVGLLYHLAKEGWTDICLVEKGELTSGSTWHAAGLVPHFIGSLNMAKVHKHGADLYRVLEEETGLSTGWHECGAVRLALTDDEVDWFHYVHGMLESVGVESHLVGPKEVEELHPLVDASDVKVALHTVNDGWADPTSVTNSMAKGARQLGAEVYRHTLVTDTNQLPDGRWEVVTDKGTIVCEHVVNASGSYAKQLGAMAGYDVPIENVVHQYVVTEPLDEVKALDVEPPVLRDPRASCYYRQEVDGLLIGPYERSNAILYGVDGIDWNKHFYLTPVYMDNILECLELAAQRIPVFGNAGIKNTISGPITHTPDSGYLLGPAPGLRNYWMCVGASIGICQGPGAGKYLAQWMVHGQTEVNVREMDPRRFGDYAPGQYTLDKAVDEYHEMYQARPPGEYRSAGRPCKRTPLYDTLDAKGAQWQEVFGWERVQYFSPDGTPERHSFRRSNAFDPVAEECQAVRERVGIADLTAFAKFEVTGADAEALLDRLSANRMPVRDGGTRLVHMLTDLGGIESEMTITRFAADRFYLNSAVVGETHDLDWLQQHVEPGEDVTVTDVTDALGLLAISGPFARGTLAKLTDADLDNESFRWLTAQEIDVAGVPCKALRVSYVGELGWELHFPIEHMVDLYNALWSAGAEFGITDFGAYAMNVMRIEKAYKAWGAELTTEITPVEADIGRFVDEGKDFLGKQAMLDRKSGDLEWILVYAEVDAGDNDCRGNEPCFDGDRIMGITTSGAYGHTVGKSLCFAYVDTGCSTPGDTFEILMMGEKRTATVLADAAYDPGNEKPRA